MTYHEAAHSSFILAFRSQVAKADIGTHFLRGRVDVGMKWSETAACATWSASAALGIGPWAAKLAPFSRAEVRTLLPYLKSPEPTRGAGLETPSIPSYDDVPLFRWRRPIRQLNEQIQRIGSSRGTFDPLLRPEAKGIEKFGSTILPHISSNT